MTYPKCEICHGSIIKHGRGPKPKEHGRCRVLLKRVEQLARQAVQAEMKRLAVPKPEPTLRPMPVAPLVTPTCALCAGAHETSREGRECRERFDRAAAAVADWRGA
jgi:hypothetical protein